MIIRDPCSCLFMDQSLGSLGTGASLSLRLGQSFFAGAALLFMSVGVEFYSYTAFCYLVIVMGLVIPWSSVLAIMDGYSLLVGCALRQSGIMAIIVVGDWVLSMLSLAAACATAGVVDFLQDIDGSSSPLKFCRRYQLSAAMAFLSWVLIAASSLLNLRLLASWYQSVPIEIVTDTDTMMMGSTWYVYMYMNGSAWLGM